jgi:hypothetical protein
MGDVTGCAVTCLFKLMQNNWEVPQVLLAELGAMSEFYRKTSSWMRRTFNV